jgi:hypothetical protein
VRSPATSLVLEADTMPSILNRGLQDIAEVDALSPRDQPTAETNDELLPRERQGVLRISRPSEGVEMPVLVNGEEPGMTSEQDDAMVDALDLAQNPPAGGRFRLSGPMDGGWRIVSLWESREHFEAFLEERLNPAREATGRPAPQLTFWEIEKVRGYEKL